MASEPTKMIFILQNFDEMRHPYAAVLLSIPVEVKWFSALAEMVIAAASETPELVIVDLDGFSTVLESALAQIKSAFGTSDLIALSSSDSAQMALQCLRSGFSDYLLKPTSPEELAWSIRKRLQNHELFQRFDEGQVDVIRAITQISNCTAAPMVRIFALEYVSRILEAEGAAWVVLSGSSPVVLCALPKEVNQSQLIFNLPSRAYLGPQKTKITVNKKTHQRKIFFSNKHFDRHGIFLWGIPKQLTQTKLLTAELLIEQSELSLINIDKFDQIKHQTFIDDLTGLYNSRYLKFAITNSIIKCKEPGQSFSVLFIDVDFFKRINDSHGHLVGSEFLVAIGRTVRNAVRRIDPVFRYGGDEFVVILNETGTQGAQEIAERIRKNIERRVYVIQGRRIQTTVSIGIANYPQHAQEKDTLLKLADEAMYSAKKESRNSVHLART